MAYGNTIVPLYLLIDSEASRGLNFDVRRSVTNNFGVIKPSRLVIKVVSPVVLCNLLYLL